MTGPCGAMVACDGEDGCDSGCGKGASGSDGGKKKEVVIVMAVMCVVAHVTAIF